MRLALAAVSGVLCALHFRWRNNTGWLDFGWLDFGIAGALFAVAVLCPYLRSGRALMLRAAALVGASALSYFCAVTMALNADSWFSINALASFLLASFVGVTIVLVTAKVLVPLRVTAAFWLLGLAASLVGGVAMYAGLEVFGDSILTTVVSFCVWHVLACIAIYRGHQSNDAESGLLAAFTRARGRFSIVPGWMRLSHSTLH